MSLPKFLVHRLLKACLTDINNQKPTNNFIKMQKGKI